ncbi:MAG: ABC transporter substrate-binding protein [Spirochaetia bacterium]|jgi:branched-chain amino acid transport system substrate-binding protein|nr:ABC transporter substrate-binding protein [Spirochaetia bacterium]
MKSLLKKLLLLGTMSVFVVGGAFANGEKETKESSSNDVILLGGLYPLTGDLADSGQNMQKGIKMALDEINAAGGINGKKLDIAFGDSQGKGQTGMTEMERLITQKKVLAVIGAYQSSVTEVVAQVAENYSVPFITANATSDNLTGHGYNYFFRLAPTNMMFIRDMIYSIRDLDKANDAMNVKTIAVCADNTEVGQQTVEWTRYWAKQLGYNYLGEVLYSQGAADLSSEVLQLKEMNPDALIVDCYVSDAILLTKTFHEQGYAPKLCIAKGNGFSEASYVPAVGSLCNGISLATEFVAGSKGSAISDKFKKEFGIAMNGHSAEAYITTYVLAQAIQNVANDGKEITSETIKNALGKIEIDKSFQIGAKPIIILPYDKIAFTDSQFNGKDYKNQNMGGNLTVVQYQNQKQVTVWPVSIANGNFAYPAPLK